MVAVLAAIFAVVHAGEAGGWLPGLFRWYLDDLLFLPLVLTLALVVQRQAGAGPKWVMPVTQGLGAVAFAGLVFEGLLPGVFGRGVSDPVDVLAYVAGWVIFQAVLNRLERLEVPTIALLHGYCLGLALELALACDRADPETRPRVVALLYGIIQLQTKIRRTVATIDR